MSINYAKCVPEQENVHFCKRLMSHCQLEAAAHSRRRLALFDRLDKMSHLSLRSVGVRELLVNMSACIFVQQPAPCLLTPRTSLISSVNVHGVLLRRELVLLLTLAGGTAVSRRFGGGWFVGGGGGDDDDDDDDDRRFRLAASTGDMLLTTLSSPDDESRRPSSTAASAEVDVDALGHS